MNVDSPMLRHGREAWIAEAVRTPIGRAHREKGAFRDTHPNELLGACLKQLIDRTGIEPSAVEDVICGCTAQFGEQSRNIARNSWLQAGYPAEVPAITIDRRCGSAQSAVAYASSLIASGAADVVIAAGVEHMDHIPINSPLKINEIFGTPWPQELLDLYEFIPQGLSAELIAEKWEISREELDALALESHIRAQAATEARYFEREIVPIETPHGTISADQGIRPGGTPEKLAGLPTPFKEGGRITAATSSQLSDGAAAVLLCSDRGAERLGLDRRARIVDQISVGVDPILMLTGPIPATEKMLARTGLGLRYFDLIEVNEAFASVVLAWAREFSPDMSRVNPNGSGISLGHPVGATGSRLVVSALHELERTDSELALITMCCGGGLGTGTIIQRV